MSGFTDPNPGYWEEYGPFQRIKHDLVRCYLNGWFPKLGAWAGRVLYYYGFAAPTSSTAFAESARSHVRICLRFALVSQESSDVLLDVLVEGTHNGHSL